MSIEIMSRVWKYADSSLGELLVFLALADHSNDKGFCWPGVEGLAKKSRLSERQTRYILRNLEAKGYIKTLIQQGPRGCNMYEITLGEGAKTAPPAQGAIHDMEGGNPRQQGGQPIAPESSVNHQEPSVHRDKGFVKPVVEEMVNYGKEIGLPEDESMACHDHYESNGWMVGRSRMSNWKAAMRYWNRNYQKGTYSKRYVTGQPKESASAAVQRILKGIQ
jgi:hypothetical protein